MYPDAEVIGVDVSPVPEQPDQPKNLMYVQGDIMQLAISDDPRFAESSFDYVFSRLLLMGITDWPSYITLVKRFLKYGGWAELQDMAWKIYAADDKCLSYDWWHWPYFSSDAADIGLELDLGNRLRSFVDEAGFSNVAEKVYQLPLKPDKDTPGAELIEKSNGAITGPGARALTKRVCGPKRDPEMVEKLADDMVESFANCRPGDHGNIHVVIGQNPA